ncbi:spore coat protein [Bacillus lacus]|uniref:Spore coat protein n=1 Tax=Metabacillus lacus TaxID=1983721 RepID=A0A7X2IYB0_9BACI|nr:spore coat protein [Metabacillus lacus]MRX71894.1 spore coat protein [Metabacillus lacus]
MTMKKLGIHEMMEVHELVNFKTVSLVKSKMLQGLVFDQDLRALMDKDVKQSIVAITALQALLPEEEIQ